MINFETATREELLAYIEQQKLNKKTNKLDKLTKDLEVLFNDYSNNSDDKLLQLHFILSILYSNLEIPVLELLDKLDYIPEEDELKKLVIITIKTLGKELKLRESKKNKDSVVTETVVKSDINTPL